jgi:hypothetical protein
MDCVGCKIFVLKWDEKLFHCRKNGKINRFYWPRFKIPTNLVLDINCCVDEYIEANNDDYKIYLSFYESYPAEISLAVISFDEEIFVLSKEELIIKDIIE